MRKLQLTVLCSLLSSCFFQGPWDYSPKSSGIYAGVELNAMLVAGKPVQNFCLERIYALNEEYSPAFAWYQNVDLRVQGKWQNRAQGELNFKVNPLNPSCFDAEDTSALPLAGEKYQLIAQVRWDSAGSSTLTSLSAETQIPKSFQLIHQKGALVNQAASPGVQSQAASGSSADLQSLFAALPDSARIGLMAKWGDTLRLYSTDTLKLQSYLPLILKDADSLSRKYEQRWRYSDGDTVMYMTGNLNNRPHFYLSKYDSASLGGVLITQRLDSTGAIPENSFSAIAKRFNGGLVPPRSLAFAGTIRPILSYPNQSLRGVRILDTISVLNTYFFGGKNRFYFYGVDSSYQKYLDSYVQGQSDPKNRPQFNVQGAWGYFSGAVVDSMTVYVKIPAGIQQYSYFETKADQCAPQKMGGQVVAEGWSTAYCRAFEPEYCQTVSYNERNYAQSTSKIGQYSTGKWEGYSDCKVQSVRASVLQNLEPLTLASQNQLGDVDSASRAKGLMLACLELGFAPEICKDSRSQSLGVQKSDLLQLAWDYCLDRKWKDSAQICPEIMVSYVRVGKSTAQVLKDQVSQFCTQNSQNPYCKL